MAQNLEVKAASTVPAPKITEEKNASAKRTAALKRVSTRSRTKAITYIQRSLKTSLDASISSNWQWPTGTRDIIDTGKLKNSLKLVEKHNQKSSSLSIKYTAPYAAAIHYGWVGVPYGNPNLAPRQYPGRPWVTAVLEGTNGQKRPDFNGLIEKAFEEAWAEQFGK